jgi:hypothetical protein
VKLKDVGQRKGHTGHYPRDAPVRARPEDAQQAAARLQQVQARGGMYELVLDVPVVYRKHPEDAPPPEIRIDW